MLPHQSLGQGNFISPLTSLLDFSSWYRNPDRVDRDRLTSSMSLDATTVAIAVAGMSVCVGGLVLSQSCEKPKPRAEVPKSGAASHKKSKPAPVEEKKKANKKVR